MSPIPFIHDLEAPVGKVEVLSPLVRRIICPNPGPYTYTGTGTFIIGLPDKNGDVAVIDPGPNNKEHMAAILHATRGETISHILVTHTHADHSPLAAPLAKATGATTYAFGAHSGDNEEGLAAMEEGVDKNFVPTHRLADGEIIKTDNWTIKAHHTPGHTSNHMCYELEQEKTLFTGDHIMAWSTSIIIPPDGSMAAYMLSLDDLLAKDFKTLRPTHGPAIIEPHAFIEALMAHRMEREAEILNAVVKGRQTVKDIVLSVYVDLPKELHNAAGMSALAHLILLVDDGRVRCEGKPSLASRFYLG